MFLTLPMIKELLDEEYLTSISCNQPLRALGSIKRFLPCGGNLDENLLYLCNMNNPPTSVEADLNYLVIGEPGESFAASNYISVPEGTEEITLFENVHAFFDKYMYWERTLQRSLSENRTIQSLVDLSLDVFENPILVYDMALRMLGADESQEQFLSKYWTRLSGLSGGIYMNQDTITESRGNGFLDLVEKLEGTSYFHNYSTNILVSSIHTSSRRLGFITIPEKLKPLTSLHVALSEILAAYMAQVLEAQIYHSERTDSRDSFPMQIFNATRQEDYYLKHRLYRLNWFLEDRYAIMVVKPQQNAANSEFAAEISNYRYLLTQLLPDSYITALNDDLFISIRKTTFLHLEPNTQDAFCAFLTIRHLVCGCSNDFYDYGEVASYYYQAVEAAKLLCPGDRYYPVSLYQDHFAQHVASTFARHYELNRFIHPAVLTLHSNDPHGILLKTLYIYLLNDRRYAVTSEKLYIHKSTLKYRLDKIRQIAGSICFEAEARVSVLLSLNAIMPIDENKDTEPHAAEFEKT